MAISIMINSDRHPDQMGIINRLAVLEDRKAADALRCLVVNEGKEKIAKLELAAHAAKYNGSDNS